MNQLYIYTWCMAGLCALTMYDTYNDKVTVESSRGLTHAGSITYLAEDGIDNTKSCFLQHRFSYFTDKQPFRCLMP